MARLLLSPAGAGAGLLLLDEPTNHLDEAAKSWLARWIKDSPCTTVIVSHEQELMDGACDHVAEVRGRGLHWYTGNFAAFLEARDERIAVAKALYEKQLAEEADLKDFIRRFSANASKSTQAQSRAKLLEKLQKEMLKTVSAATADGVGRRRRRRQRHECGGWRSRRPVTRTSSSCSTRSWGIRKRTRF